MGDPDTITIRRRGGSYFVGKALGGSSGVFATMGDRREVPELLAALVMARGLAREMWERPHEEKAVTGILDDRMITEESSGARIPVRGEYPTMLVPILGSHRATYQLGKYDEDREAYVVKWIEIHTDQAGTIEWSRPKDESHG